ncbi:MAG: hypothetical protein JWN95_1791 [Frankiales bacterium]|nr:hypothetical protein [Frankiales bacterium]
MTDSAVTWLVGEVSDLLDAGSVGLYEFVWILRGGIPEMADVERHLTAGHALERLLSEGTCHLVRLEWPSEDVIDGAIGVAPGPGDWREPSQGNPYLAVARN